MHWSETKQEVFCFESDIIVSAGAGSGKTAALVELYLRLLAGETELGDSLAVDEIVAITFTEKAAGEMKDRVRREAARRRSGENGAFWGRCLRELPNAHIATFHSFCSIILRENPAEAGVDPSFVVLDDLAAGAELHAALDEVIEGELKGRSPEIRVLLELFPLTSGGYGSGLRECLLALFRQRSGSLVGAEEFAGRLRDWEKLARSEFAEGVAELDRLMAEVGRILQGALRKFHDQLRDLPALRAATILDLDSSETVSGIELLAGSIGGSWGNEKPVKDALLAAMEKMRRSWCQIHSTPAAAAFLALLGRLEEAYARRKERRGALDFEDLQVKTFQLLQRDAAVREEYRRRFRVVMVDEFQDTNPLQKELVSLLCGPDQRLFLVGDPKQSIYLFRGADVAVFAQAGRDVVARGGKLLYFQESFRSRQGVIDFVNRFFSSVMQGGSEDFQVRYAEGDHLEPQRRDWDGVPCVELLTVGNDGNSRDRRGREAATIATRIRRMVESGAKFGDIAILFRRFSNLKLFERELRRAGIPYYVVKGKGFYQCQEVLDLLNFLRYLDYTSDLPALAGVLRSPICGVSDETLYLLSRLEGGIASWEKCFAQSPVPSLQFPVFDRIAPADREKLHSLAHLFARLRPLRDRLTLPELMEEILTATCFSPKLSATFQGSQKVANLRKLIELARTFDGGAEGSLRRFIASLSQLVEEMPTEAEAVIAAEGEDVVRLMTVHQSKGLEFPVVFVPELGGEQPRFSMPVIHDDRHGIAVKLPLPGGETGVGTAYAAISELRRAKEDAELKRLFYVAVTRAMDRLVLSGEGRGPWRAWIDAFLAENGTDLVTVEAADQPASLYEVQEQNAAPMHAQAVPDSTSLELGLARGVGFVPPLPTQMSFSPTALEDYRSCPRKYYYKAGLGLDEGVFAELFGERFGRRTAVRGMSALAKGDLAHRLLERINFGAPVGEIRQECLRLADILADEPDDAGVAEVVEQLASFAVSPLAMKLAGKELLREHPFVLKLRGGADYFMRGTMDLVALDDDGITVYDYKYTRKEGADLEGYRFQIGCYMLALAQAWPNRRVEGRLLFLPEGAEETVSWDLTSLCQEVVAIMDAIRSRRMEGEFERIKDCTGTHCPFAGRCRQRGNE